MPIDYSRYPKNWKTEIVPRILKRANNDCENCGLTNYQLVHSVPMRINIDGKYKIKRFWCSTKSDLKRMTPFSLGGYIKEVKVVLAIVHLDHDETNHEVNDDRLKAWCQYCHLNYDAEEKYRRACEKQPQLNL